MNPLQTFYENEPMREGVKAFLITTLSEMAITRAFKGNDVTGIKEGKEAVDKMFAELDRLFGVTKKPQITNSR